MKFKKSIHTANSPVAENMRRLMRTMGLKQKDVAERIGRRKQDLSDMLGGRLGIKNRDVVKFCNTLGVSASELFRE